jgi:hypothetical protein
MDGERRDEEQPEVSRITVEFMGPGMADIQSATFENVSVGQMLCFGRWAEWRVEEAIEKYKAMKREHEKRVARPTLMVPRGRMQ